MDCAEENGTSAWKPAPPPALSDGEVAACNRPAVAIGSNGNGGSEGRDSTGDGEAGGEDMENAEWDALCELTGDGDKLPPEDEGEIIDDANGAVTMLSVGSAGLEDRDKSP